MLILALESSAKAASAALVKDGELLAQYSQSSGLTHSRTLLPMIEDMFKNTDISPETVDAIAVAQGPGSFTGIRIGISTVKGLAWALDKPCIGVSTLEAMAWHGVSAGGLICPVMDARRSQVYNALFEINDGTVKRLCEDRAISLEELCAELKADGREPFLVGDGMEITAKYLEASKVGFKKAAGNLALQSAWGVAMAAMDKKPESVHDLLPVYLRLSQAERERQERMK